MPGSLRAHSVTASDCACNSNGSKKYIFAIGSLNYDFGTEARRDSFKQLMPGVTPDGLPFLEPWPPASAPASAQEPTVYPPNPYDARQMVNYLGGYPPPDAPWPAQGGFPELPHFPPNTAPNVDPGPFPESPPLFPPAFPPEPKMFRGFPAHLSEATELIWTLNIEQTPVYAIRPAGSFSTEAYQRLVAFLAGQVRPDSDDNFVSRVSIPATYTNDTVQLFSGQVVPVITPHVRGMYAWNERQLILQVLRALKIDPDSDAAKGPFGVISQTKNFLARVYYELRNLGQTSQERALNFSATNAFQIAGVVAEVVLKANAIAATTTVGGSAPAGFPNPSGLFALDSITVSRSPFCRIDSDCWDVILKFFYPNNVLVARDLFSFTIDVSDSYPVPIGPTRQWSVPT
jgi:hypothetical protein